MAERTYKSRKSNTTYIVTGEPSRAFLQATGEMATSNKVIKQMEDIRRGAYDFATVDWMARQLSNTF
ncbi:hypothetical protein [Fibrobacter sp. UWH4]|uniref:hypothetical protein n=1 Tax=Fibrobacter sp. UWH4 TaxID=1896210 RepID=UPI0009155A6F|nr:hypothetical protein [Fibrobacter sp. UWH4]SHL05581.1 hypothetical protein SAMN05720762_10473 [Fibrobacter sp. UWH4]